MGIAQAAERDGYEGPQTLDAVVRFLCRLLQGVIVQPACCRAGEEKNHPIIAGDFSDDGEHFHRPVVLPQGVVRASTTPVYCSRACQPAQPASPRVDRSTVNDPVIEGGVEGSDTASGAGANR